MRTTEKFEAKRQQRKQKPKLFILFLLALSILIALFLFINSSFFFIGSIVVEGNKYLLADDVIHIAGVQENANIFRINIHELKNRLLCDLRVEKVEISRKFPATIVINVKERQPLAYVASGYGFVEIDKQGIVLSALKTLRQVNIPIITGVRLGNVYVGDKVDSPEIVTILPYLSNLQEETLNQISEINIGSLQHIYAYTVSSINIRLGNMDRLADKANMTNHIMQEMKERYPVIEYIDLTYASPFIKFKS